MRNWLHVILGVLFAAALAFDFYAWGGLSRSVVLGKIATEAATRELSLASIYLPAGSVLVDISGLGRTAATYADEQFAPVQARVLANPAAAMETFARDLPFALKAPYYGAPILLVLFVLAYWRRPRVVRTMGRR
jgi:hypothetical protein